MAFQALRGSSLMEGDAFSIRDDTRPVRRIWPDGAGTACNERLPDQKPSARMAVCCTNVALCVAARLNSLTAFML